MKELTPDEHCSSHGRIFFCKYWRSSHFVLPIQGPHGQSTEVLKAGQQPTGAQRYRCQNGGFERRLFLRQYPDRGRLREIPRQRVERALPGRGMRAVTRVLRIRPTTVSAVLKKVLALQPVNTALNSAVRYEKGQIPSWNTTVCRLSACAHLQVVDYPTHALGLLRQRRRPLLQSLALDRAAETDDALISIYVNRG